MLNDIINGLNNLWNWLSQIGANISDSIVQAYSWVYSSLSAFGEKIKEALNNFGQFIYDGLNWIAQNFYNAYEWLSNRINEGLKWISDGITWIGTQIYNFGNWIWNSVIGFINWVWEGIQSIINYIWSIICKAWNELIDFINEWIMYINKLLNNWFLSLRRKFTNFIVVNLTLPTMFKSFQKFILYPNWKNLLSTFSIPILAPILGRLVDSVIPKPQSEFVIFFPPLKLPKLDKEELYIPKPIEPPSPPIDVIPPRPPTDQIQKICRNYIKSKINVDLVNLNILFSNNKIISRINLNLLEKNELKSNNKIKSSIDKKVEAYIEYPYLNKLKILNYFDMFLGDIKKIKHKIKTSYILINKEIFKLKEINKIKSKLLIDIIEEVKNLVIKNNIKSKIDIEKILLPVNLISKSNYIKLNCEYNLNYSKFITNKNIIRDSIQLKVIKNIIPIETINESTNKSTNLIKSSIDVIVKDHVEYEDPYIYVIIDDNGKKLYRLNIYDFSLHSKVLDLPDEISETNSVRKTITASNVSKFGDYITICKRFKVESISPFVMGGPWYHDFVEFRNKNTLDVLFIMDKLYSGEKEACDIFLQVGGWKDKYYALRCLSFGYFTGLNFGIGNVGNYIIYLCYKHFGPLTFYGGCDGDNTYIFYSGYGLFIRANINKYMKCPTNFYAGLDSECCKDKEGNLPNDKVKGIAVGKDIILVCADKIYVYDKELNLIASHEYSYNIVGFGGKFSGEPLILSE